MLSSVSYKFERGGEKWWRPATGKNKRKSFVFVLFLHIPNFFIIRGSEKCYAVDVQKQDLYCFCTSLPMCGFIAQLVEHRTGNAEVTGLNPVEALIFFRLLLSNDLNWKIYCDDHSSLSRSIFFRFSKS